VLGGVPGFGAEEPWQEVEEQAGEEGEGEPEPAGAGRGR
jgi:hypothetical protein